MNEIMVTIVKNDSKGETKKRLRIDKTDNFEKILCDAGRRFNMEVKILYAKDGAVIDDPTELREDETIYVSAGEKFQKEPAINLPKVSQKVIKIGIIGFGSVGKSALTVRFTQKVFIDKYIPTFEDAYKKVIKISDEFVNVDILDSSGMDEFVVMRPNWFKENEGFIMVYSIISKAS